jgi:hypothetical protein
LGSFLCGTYENVHRCSNLCVLPAGSPLRHLCASLLPSREAIYQTLPEKLIRTLIDLLTTQQDSPMSYFVAGAALGGVGTYVGAKGFDVSFQSGGGYNFFPSNGHLLVGAGTVVGGCIGLGVGLTLLRLGKHPLNKTWRYFRAKRYNQNLRPKN